ncbi:MAG TPA: prepilin-type N-terminal cleavage/methylation domain-containing protein [Candidatus Dormibacteraeota bacterium]|jgi:prepilin-type N-terminal cleavage/methylation domain-containing protein|nr:prepilin-type N-terminal cleavage/methylation domain-containing protein [Candidatus Dormibacteraeota bacterium]
MQREQGFTVIEVVVAVLILTIGILALVSSSALVTRMIARGGRTAAMASFASQRLEQLRVTACASQAAGTDTLWRGSTPIDINTWRFVAAGANHWRIIMNESYVTAANTWRADSSETEISCLR